MSTIAHRPLRAAARRHAPHPVLLGIAAFAALALLPAEAQASCKGSFCVSGQDINGVHVVTFTNGYTNVTHFNWAGPDGKQHELGANQRQFSFANLASGTVEQYSMQACSGGGFMQKSRCSTWIYFTHTVP